MSYASQTQALFMIPVILWIIMLFSNETKIAQNYEIRKNDLQYYMTFTSVIIVPQLIIDIFILHILEIVHGYRIYDYFTYCNYRFNVRQTRWLTNAGLDKSIIHSFRSLDALCFSSQFYYLISLITWGIIFLYLGVTSMIRNDHNPFADPTLFMWLVMIIGGSIILKFILNSCARRLGLWRLTVDGRIKFDNADANKMDAAHNIKRLIKNVQTNPFRHKFIIMNREWIV